MYTRKQSQWFKVAQVVVPLSAAVIGITSTAIGINLFF